MTVNLSGLHSDTEDGLSPTGAGLLRNLHANPVQSIKLFRTWEDDHAICADILVMVNGEPFVFFLGWQYPETMKTLQLAEDVPSTHNLAEVRRILYRQLHQDEEAPSL